MLKHQSTIVMNTFIGHLKPTHYTIMLTLALLIGGGMGNGLHAQNKENKNIKLALLLDTSNSMDGLIDQAKAQLWNLVNELAKARHEGKQPKLEIALYEYGNDRLPASEGYIRLVTAMTTDLDQVSADLFSLTTNGGNEFCGQVIQSSLVQLTWGKAKKDLQYIFIAGNEPFTQGNVSFAESCLQAKEKGIVVNTIFCGTRQEGINTSWKAGADITGGTYMNINQNNKTVFIETPYDDAIEALNEELNDTYLVYGSGGGMRKQNQIIQDQNAQQYGKGGSVSRAISKSRGYYRNTHWDLVDAAATASFDIDDYDEAHLPEAMKGMSNAQKMAYIKKFANERAKIQESIRALGKKRDAFITSKKAEAAGNTTAMLDNAMLAAIKKHALTMDFEFVE